METETGTVEEVKRGRGRPPLSPEVIAARQQELLKKKQILEQQRILLRKKHELEQVLEWRKKNWRIRYYVVKDDGSAPGMNPIQEKFHRAKPKSKIRIISGSNRLGKSDGGINEDVAHALGFRPWLAETDPDYKVDIRIPNKGLICGESFQVQVQNTILPKLLGDPLKSKPGAVPTTELAAVRKNPQGIVTYIRFKNGSEIFLQSYDQELTLFESSDFDWAHFDEPPPRAIWVAVSRGLTDRNGPCWLTMTPISEPWIYDELYSRKDVFVIYGDIEDNLGFGLSREGIDNFASKIRDEEKEARLHGKFFHLSGLVYKSYGPLHRIPRERLFKNGVSPAWSLFMHIDCHPKKPHRSVWMAIAPDQRKYVVGALQNEDYGNLIKPFCEAMRVYEMTVLKYPRSRIERLIDPLAGTPNPIREGYSMWDEFDECGFTCKPGSKNLGAGILLMQDELRHDEKAGIYPNIFFCDDLENVHYEMTHYIWDEHANRKTAEKYDEKQSPRAKNDDYIQGIHRILLERPYCDEGNDYAEAEERMVANGGGNRVTGY